MGSEIGEALTGTGGIEEDGGGIDWRNELIQKGELVSSEVEVEVEVGLCEGRGGWRRRFDGFPGNDFNFHAHCFRFRFLPLHPWL